MTMQDLSIRILGDQNQGLDGVSEQHARYCPSQNSLIDYDARWPRDGREVFRLPQSPFLLERLLSRTYHTHAVE